MRTNTDTCSVNFLDYPTTRRKIQCMLQAMPLCLLCCDVAVYVGVSVPEGVTRWEVVCNPRLLTCYALCRTCHALPNTQTLAEGALLAPPSGR